MSTFTEELRRENFLTLKYLNTAKRLGMRTLQGRRALFDNKTKLISHLITEDKEILATLKGASNTHPDLAQTLQMFEDDITNTTKYVLEFFKKHTTNEANKELSGDFDLLFNHITKRIEKEENIFYDEYDEIKKEEELLKKLLL